MYVLAVFSNYLQWSICHQTNPNQIRHSLTVFFSIASVRKEGSFPIPMPVPRREIRYVDCVSGCFPCRGDQVLFLRGRGFLINH